MKAATKYDALLAAVRSLVDAERASKAACDRRGALPHGSSRARVTTANANWANAAEHRDRCQDIAAREVLAAGILTAPFLAAIAHGTLPSAPESHVSIGRIVDAIRTIPADEADVIAEGLCALAEVPEHTRAWDRNDLMVMAAIARCPLLVTAVQQVHPTLPDLSTTNDEHVRILADHGTSARVRAHAAAELERRQGGRR